MTNANKKHDNRDKRAEERYENEGGESQSSNRERSLDQKKGYGHPHKRGHEPYKKIHGNYHGLDDEDDDRKYSFEELGYLNRRSNEKLPGEDKNAPRGR